jgi:hypothetical protein
MKLEEFENILVKRGVIQEAAIEDAEGYDGGATQERVQKAFEDIASRMDKRELVHPNLYEEKV